MKSKVNIFLSYFPVLLVTMQVICNLLSFVVSKNTYNQWGFYLNTLFGTNVLFAVFLLFFTFRLKFCSVSRAAAIAEVLFGINYLIVKEDNLYNILFQVIVGSVALVWTFRYYIRKFPLCKMSLMVTFFSSLFASKGDCRKGVDNWERHLYTTIEKKYNEGTP